MDFETVIMLSLRDLNYDNIDHPLTERDIKVRFRDLAMKFHPDKQIFSDDSWMIKINNAKDFLIQNLDKVNAYICAKNPAALREEAIRKEKERDTQMRAEKEKEEEQKKRAEEERQERLKKEQEERLRRQEEERKRREALRKAEEKRKREERRRQEEERKKFEAWYASLSDKEKKKYDKEQIIKAKKEKKMLFLKQHPHFYNDIIGATIFVSLIIVISMALFWRFNLYPKPFYTKGLNLYNDKEYSLSIEQFKKAGNYKDAKLYLKRAQAEALVLEGKEHEAGFIFGGIYKDEDYKRSKELLWKDFVINQTIAMSSDYMVAIQDNNKLIGMQLNEKKHEYKDFVTWENIEYLAMTENSIVGLDSNGKVWVEGSGNLRKKVNSWKNIVQIYTAGDIVFGLRADGKILHTSSKPHTVLKKIKKWEHVVNFDIQESVYYPYDNSGNVYYYFACGVFEDGTAKYIDNGNDYTDIIDTWEDIKLVSLSYGEWIGTHIVGLKKDNTVVACGTSHNGVLNVTLWENVIQVHTMSTYTFGLKKDGTIVLAGSDAFSKKDVSKIENAVYMPKIGNLMVVDSLGKLQCEAGKILAMAEWENLMLPNNPFK